MRARYWIALAQGFVAKQPNWATREHTLSKAARVLAAMGTDPYAEWYALDVSERAGLRPGTIYPSLARLEKGNWIMSRWQWQGDDQDPSRRRLYHLTTQGVRAARDLLDGETVRL